MTDLDLYVVDVALDGDVLWRLDDIAAPDRTAAARQAIDFIADTLLHPRASLAARAKPINRAIARRITPQGVAA